MSPISFQSVKLPSWQKSPRSVSPVYLILYIIAFEVFLDLGIMRLIFKPGDAAAGVIVL